MDDFYYYFTMQSQSFFCIRKPVYASPSTVLNESLRNFAGIFLDVCRRECEIGLSLEYLYQLFKFVNIAIFAH